ncbi:MAG: hypothetical protein JXA69_08480 [Phycisphaerae bacterium]|nr:hypothetical protein [Phycisphaerae bacterium]
MQHKHIVKMGSLLVVAVAGLTVLPAGCEETFRYHRPLEPVADRLMAAYPDLSSGRFLIVADFEAVEQGAIFRLAPPTAAGYVGIVGEQARAETGAGSLKVRLATAEQELVVEDTGQGPWTLPRDWGRFNLLLMSVYSPRPVAGAVFRACSGPEKTVEYARDGIVLREGWNLIRIDIGDMAQRIDIADVRQLRFGFTELDRPIELYVDDMVLADNASDVFGSRTSQPGDLYVRVEGRRFRVGVVERFELVFARGRIVEWYDLGSDPDRVRNLTGGGPLGPTPVMLGLAADGSLQIDERGGWERLGPAAESMQRLVETSPVRVVLWGEWRFGTPDAVTAAEAEGPFHRWVYTIYPTGKVCLEFAGTLAATGTAVREVGYLVSCADGEGFEPLGPGPQTDGEALSYVLFCRDEPGGPDLLYAFQRAATAPKARAVRHDADPRLGMLFHGGPADAVAVWSAMFNVWPSDVDTRRQAEPIVLDYANPLPIAVDAGRLVRTDAGDTDNDGFNEARGHYTLEPEGNAVRVRLDGRHRMRFGPAFKIVDVAGRDVWAYVDGLEIRPIARDEEDNAIFQIPRVIDKETLVEVTTRERSDAAP